MLRQNPLQHRLRILLCPECCSSSNRPALRLEAAYPQTSLHRSSRQNIQDLRCSFCAPLSCAVPELCVQVNKDGLLDDTEINEFQRICFNAPLEADELTKIKSLVASRLNDPSDDSTTLTNFLSSLEGYVDESELTGIEIGEGGESKPRQIGIRNDGLSITGFIWLQNHFIQSGRLETTWKALRTFGYGDDLNLSESFLFPRFDVPSDSAVELSPLGYQFLTDVFENFDKVCLTASFHRTELNMT